MKKLVFIPLFLLFAANSFGQDSIPKQGTISVQKPDTTIYIIVDELPVFPGGDTAIMKFVSTYIRVPRDIDSQTASTSYVTFVVEKDGKVSNVELLRGAAGCKACDNEALRVINKMPDWIPGKHKGKVVRVRYNLPIRFVIR